MGFKTHVGGGHSKNAGWIWLVPHPKPLVLEMPLRWGVTLLKRPPNKMQTNNYFSFFRSA
jgi:hypothetical protein